MGQEAGQSRRLRAGLMLAVKLGVAALLVLWLLRSGRLRLGDIARVHADLDMLGVVLGQVAVLGVPLLRWRRLLLARGIDLGPGRVLHVGLISYFAIMFLPATGGQEAVRLYYATRLRRGRGPEILATLVLDRFVGLIGLSALAAAFCVLLLARYDAPSTRALTGAVVALLVGLAVATAVLIAARPAWLLRLGDRVRPVRALFDALEEFRHRRGLLAEALALSVLAHLASCVSMYFGFRALGAPVSMVEATAITPLVTLTSILPVTPLGIGVADLVAEDLFQRVGVGSGAEATMLVRAVTAVLCLASGIAFLWPVAEGGEGAVKEVPEV